MPRSKGKKKCLNKHNQFHKNTYKLIEKLASEMFTQPFFFLKPNLFRLTRELSKYNGNEKVLNP